MFHKQDAGLVKSVCTSFTQSYGNHMLCDGLQKLSVTNARSFCGTIQFFARITHIPNSH